MLTLAFINQKGGVGKTTLSMNVAVRLKMAGAKVLLVDLDPQCSLSYILGADRAKPTVWDVLTGAAAPADAVYKAAECDILPGSGKLSLLERQSGGKAMLLRNALQQLKDSYQFVVVDSPPALGLLMLNALAASDSIVIPAYADIFSLQGIGQLYTTVRSIREKCNPDLKIDGILLSGEDRSSRLSQDVERMMKETARKLGTDIFETNICRDSAVREAQALRQSIYTYAPDSAQAAEYSLFTLEYLNRLRQRLHR